MHKVLISLLFNIVIATNFIHFNHVESVLTQKFENVSYTRLIHSMFGHSIILLSYVYKQRVKSNIVNSSFSDETAKLSAEVTININKY